MGLTIGRKEKHPIDSVHMKNEEAQVELYDFEVLRGEEVIAAERSVPLYSPKAAWPRIIRLAKSLKISRVPNPGEGTGGDDHSRRRRGRAALFRFRLFRRGVSFGRMVVRNIARTVRSGPVSRDFTARMTAERS